MWVNCSHYPPRTPEMLLLNLLAITMATFLIETLHEGPEGQVAIIVVAIFNRFQPLNQVIISLERNDKSSPLVPTWISQPNMILQGESRRLFLATLETVLNKLLDIPTFTSPFVNTKITMAYYTLINDLKNACHMLSITSEARFVIPTDTKARRDFAKYLTNLDTRDLDIMLHRGVASVQEMMMCNSTGRAREGRQAMRSFGLLAAAYLRENRPTEKNANLDLLIWLGLQATGTWQEVRFEWMPAYVAMGSGTKLLRSQPGMTSKFNSASHLWAWAQGNGHAEAITMIQQTLLRPRYSLEAAARAAVGLPSEEMTTVQRYWEGQKIGMQTARSSHFWARGILQDLAHSRDLRAQQRPTDHASPAAQTSQGFTHTAGPEAGSHPPGRKHTYVALNIPSPRPRHACGPTAHLPASPWQQAWQPATSMPPIATHHRGPENHPILHSILTQQTHPLDHLDLLAHTAATIGRAGPDQQQENTNIPSAPDTEMPVVALESSVPPAAHVASTQTAHREEALDKPLDLASRPTASLPPSAGN